MTVERGDTLAAQIVLHVDTRLKGKVGRIGCAILEHYNKHTGQCDPSFNRLAKLCGTSRDTVIRATDKLDELNLILKLVHSGKAYRNQYEPNWVEFRRLFDEWAHKKKTLRVSEDGQGGSTHATTSEPGKDAALEQSGSTHATTLVAPMQPPDPQSGSTHATQTPINNKPVKETPTQAEQNCPPSNDSGFENGLWKKERVRRPNLVPFLQPFKNGNAPSRKLAAEQSAERRLDADLRKEGIDAYIEIVGNLTNDVHRQAIAAEMRKPHSGAGIVKDAIIQRARAAQ